MSSLYTLTNQWQEVTAMMDNPDIDKQCVIDTLESLEGDIENKAESIFKVTKNIDADIEAIKIEMTRLAARKATLEAQKKSLLDYLKSKLLSIGKKKIKTPIVTISFRKGSESVKIIDINDVPFEFLKEVDPTTDKELIKRELKLGRVIKGVELVRGPESMIIK